MKKEPASHPRPLPTEGGGVKEASGEREKNIGRPRRAPGEHDLDVLQWAQELYEAGVLPVREIARLAGVTERMIYKYAQSGGWRRRRGCAACGTYNVATHRAASACVTASRKARAAAAKALADARARAARIKAEREGETRCRVIDRLCHTLSDVTQMRAEVWTPPKTARPRVPGIPGRRIGAPQAKPKPLRVLSPKSDALAERLQHAVMKALERMV